MALHHRAADEVSTTVQTSNLVNLRRGLGTRSEIAWPKQPRPANPAGQGSFPGAACPRRARAIRVRALAQGVQQ
ncbi:protein of unknown function [Burkholderia multivorans]